MAAAETRILYLGNKLLKHGFTPTSVETLGPLLAKRYRVRIASAFRNQILRLLHMMFSVVVNAPRTDVVLIDTYSSQAFHYAWLCGLLARWCRLPYIPILRGGDLADRLERSPALCKRYFGRAYANVVPSAFLMAHFQTRFENLIHLPNNIPLENYPFLERSRLRPRLLYVRAFQKVYNPTMAVRVLAKLIARHPDARLCMVGPDKDGTRADVVALAGELGVAERLELPGRLPKPDWIDKSRDFDIFINTTNFDNHPVSVTEAMALGLPVVSTNAGGLPNLIENGKEGLLVPCDDDRAMVEAIESLLSQPERAAQIAHAAREKVAQFDWNHLSTRWYRLLDAAGKGEARRDV